MKRLINIEETQKVLPQLSANVSFEQVVLWVYRKPLPNYSFWTFLNIRHRLF